MIAVREFTTAEDMIAHAKACRERIQNAKARPAPVAVFVRTLRPPRQAATIYPDPIGPVFVRDFMLVATPPKAFISQKIIAEVCLKHGVTKDDIFSDRRPHPLVLAKREICYRIRRETSLSFPQIGLILKKDHTTILYNFYKHLDENPDLVRACERAALQSWREATARNIERNSDYWHRSRKRRDAKRLAVAK